MKDKLPENWDELPPGQKKIWEIMHLDCFRGTLKDFYAGSIPEPGGSAIAFRLISPEEVRYGYLGVLCSDQHGEVTKVYREIAREETDSVIRCHPGFAQRLIARLERMGWDEWQDYMYDPDVEGMAIGGEDYEVYARKQDGTERQLAVLGAELSGDRRIRRIGRRLGKLINRFLRDPEKMIMKDWRSVPYP